MDSEEWDHIFEWKIENFSSQSYNATTYLKSPNFSVDCFSGHIWCLLFYPAGKGITKREHITCALERFRKDEGDKGCLIDFQISLMNAKFDILISQTGENRLFGGSDRLYGFHFYLKLNELRNETESCTENLLLVRCCIRKRLNAETYFFKWNVVLLSNGSPKAGKHFFCLEDNLYSICLSDGEDYLEITITKLTPNVPSANSIFCRISVNNSKGYCLTTLSRSHFYDPKSENNTWEFPNFMYKKDIKDYIDEYITDGEMFLLCEVAVRKVVKKEIFLNTNCETISKMEDLVDLRDSFQNLLTNKSNTDVKLRTCDDNESLAHKSILAARSPVFYAMVDQEMVGNEAGIVLLTDVDFQTLDAFLKFLYTGVFQDLDWKLARKLLMVADKYQVPNLTHRCASALSSLLTVDNVCQVLALADLVHHKILKEVSLEFAAVHATKIFSSVKCPEWIRDHPQLSAEILAYNKD